MIEMWLAESKGDHVENQTRAVGSAPIPKVQEVRGMALNGGPESGILDAWPEEIAEIPWLIPDYANKAGELAMSVHSLLIDLAGKRIIVDTCI